MSETDVPRETVLRELIAAEVRALMGRRRVSGAELARTIGVPQASLQRRLSGRYPFDVETLAKIADAFGVPLHSLFLVGHRGDADSLQMSRVGRAKASTRGDRGSFEKHGALTCTSRPSVKAA